MKLLLPLALIAAVWSICGLGDQKATNSSEKTDAKPSATAKPTPDRDSTRKELVSLANQITTAAKDGDVNYLAKITTDDFQLTDIDGTVKGKNKVLAEIKEEKNIKSFEIVDEKLVSFDENSAVLTYTLKVSGKGGQSAKAATTDTYVKQDGKWLLKSEQQTLLK